MIDTLDTFVRDLISWAHAMPVVLTLPMVLALLLVPIPLTVVIGAVAAIGGLNGLLFAVVAVPVAAVLLHAFGRSLAAKTPYFARYAARLPDITFPLLALIMPFWPFFLASGAMHRKLHEVVAVAIVVSVPASLAMGIGLVTASALQLHPFTVPVIGVVVLMAARLGWRAIRGRQVLS